MLGSLHKRTMDEESVKAGFVDSCDSTLDFTRSGRFDVSPAGTFRVHSYNSRLSAARRKDSLNYRADLARNYACLSCLGTGAFRARARSDMQ